MSYLRDHYLVIPRLLDPIVLHVYAIIDESEFTNIIAL